MELGNGVSKNKNNGKLFSLYIYSIFDLSPGCQNVDKDGKAGRYYKGSVAKTISGKSVKSGLNRSLTNTTTRLSAITTFVEIQRTVTLVSGATPPPGRKDGSIAPFQSAN